MEQRRLGASGFKLPRLRLGTFGRGTDVFAAWGSTDADADGARRLVDIGLESGLGMVHTADVHALAHRRVDRRMPAPGGTAAAREPRRA